MLEQSFTDLWNLGDAVLSVAIVPVGLTQFSHLYTGKSMDREHARDRCCDVVDRWAERALARARRLAGSTARTSCICSPNGRCPTPSYYGDFPQIENGVGAVTSLRARVREGLASLPRLDGQRIGVVTGVVDGAAHAGAARAAHRGDRRARSS